MRWHMMFLILMLLFLLYPAEWGKSQKVARICFSFRLFGAILDTLVLGENGGGGTCHFSYFTLIFAKLFINK